MNRNFGGQMETVSPGRDVDGTSGAAATTLEVPAAVPTGTRRAGNVTSTAPTRANPYPIPLVERHNLTGGLSSKLTIHLGFSLEQSPVVYEPGDACGINATNNPSLVGEILTTLNFDGDRLVEVNKVGTVPLSGALLHNLAITRISRRMVQSYATKGGCKPLLALLIPEQSVHLEEYLYGRELIDLLLEYPGVLQSPEELVALLPRMTPRLYSISSSPMAHSGELHLTVAVVRYRTHDRQRGGVVSTLLSDRIEPGQLLPIYIQPNKNFRLPNNPDAPIIMIGPGTGVAPFRSFLFERLHSGARGKNWLFFGERTAATDFFYREEWEKMTASGHLTRLDTAFSRDQEKKIYVQDRMLENASQVWDWIQDGASIYVCGDATRMAKDVDHALFTIVAQQGRMDAEGAMAYMKMLRNEHRYHRDVY